MFEKEKEKEVKGDKEGENVRIREVMGGQTQRTAEGQRRTGALRMRSFNSGWYEARAVRLISTDLSPRWTRLVSMSLKREEMEW